MKFKGFNKLFGRLVMFKPWIVIISLLCNIVIFSYSAVTANFIRLILNAVENGVIGEGSLFIKVLPFLIGIIVIAIVRTIAITLSALMDNIQTFYYVNLLRNNIMQIIYKKKNIKNIAGKSEKVFETLDVDVVKTVFPLNLITEVIGYIAYTLIAISSLLVLNWKVTIFIFIPLSISIIIIRFATKEIKKNRKANREIYERVSESISDTANLVQTIKISGARKNILNHFERLNRERLLVILKETLYESSIKAVTGSTVFIGTAIMMFVVAKSMMSGKFPIGDFSMFVWYLGALASCVDRVTELIAEIKQAEVSYDRIINLIEEKNRNELSKYVKLFAFKKLKEFEYSNISKTTFKELEVRNLSYHHDDQNGIHDVSFNVKPGMVVALAGGVGSGKSTVINALLGVIPKISGEILWNGIEVGQHCDLFTPPNVAYTSQITKLFNDSLLENLLIGKDVSKQEISDAIYNAVFEDDISEMEEGLDTIVGNRGSRLSGGQKQRLALARMFIHDAEIYMMDDSFSAIDIETETKLWKRFEKNIEEKKFACIIASNKKTVLQRADKILYFRNGRVIESGNAEELAMRCKDFNEMYNVGISS